MSYAQKAQRRENAETQKRQAIASGKKVLEVHSTKELIELCRKVRENVCIINNEDLQAWNN